jgi:hypothetical protein
MMRRNSSPPCSLGMLTWDAHLEAAVTDSRRPRSVAGEGRAFGACCFAGKLRSLPVPPDVTVARGLDMPSFLHRSLRAPLAYRLAGRRKDHRWS